MTQAAQDTKIDIGTAKAAWMDAHRRAEVRRAAARAAEDEALRLFVDYAELQQPECADFFSGLLDRIKAIPAPDVVNNLKQ